MRALFSLVLLLLPHLLLASLVKNIFEFPSLESSISARFVCRSFCPRYDTSLYRGSAKFQEVDTAYWESARERNINIIYSPEERNGPQAYKAKATGVTVYYTKTSLGCAGDIGTKSYANRSPPGWSFLENQIAGTSVKVEKLHLVADSLGGSGNFVANIVAGFSTANAKMAIYEGRVKDAYNRLSLKDTDEVCYAVEPRYDDVNRASPTSITMRAWIIRPQLGGTTYPWFDVEITNELNSEIKNRWGATKEQEFEQNLKPGGSWS